MCGVQPAAPMWHFELALKEAGGCARGFVDVVFCEFFLMVSSGVLVSF